MRAGPIRVGVIGCGEIAQVMHLPLLQELPEYLIGGLCDLSRDVVSALGHTYGVDLLTTDADELIASGQLDAVVICTYDHAPVAERALAAGLHVLIEKPLAFTAEEGRRVVGAAKAAGTVAMVGYMKLYDPAVDRLRSQVAALDEIKAITCHDFAGSFALHAPLYTQVRGEDVPKDVLQSTRDEVSARIQAMLGPGRAGYEELYALLLMLGSHDLGVLRSVFGSPSGVAFARARGDLQLIAILDYPDDVACVLEMGVGTSYEWWDQWLSVSTAAESIRLEFPNPYIRYAPSLLRIRRGEDGSAAESVITVSHANPFRTEWQHFARCVRGEAEVISTLDGAVADLELAEAIMAAMEPRAAAVLR